VAALHLVVEVAEYDHGTLRMLVRRAVAAARTVVASALRP